MLTRKFASAETRMSVALPLSDCSRQMKPGVASARALISSSAAMNSASCGLSVGARMRPTLSWAMCHPLMCCLALGGVSERRALLTAGEILYVGTCNRVEVVYAPEDGSAAGDSRQDVFRILTGREPQPGEASRILRAWTGEAAVEHLLLLACGLDSAQIGEHEIAAQLRGAWEDSRAARTCGPLLDRLMGEALGMAR